jgi:hypothetical protein
MAGPVTGRTSSVPANLHTLDATDVVEPGRPQSGADGTQPDKVMPDDASVLASLQAKLWKMGIPLSPV